VIALREREGKRESREETPAVGSSNEMKLNQIESARNCHEQIIK